MRDARERTAGPYAWLPAVIGFLALAGVAIGWVGLATLRDQLIASTGRTLALTAAESVDKLDLILTEHASRLRILARDPALGLDDELRVTARLRAFIRDHRQYRWIGVSDLSGHVMAASDPTRVGKTFGPTAWFAIARDVGLDVRTLRGSAASARGAPVLAFTVPLLDARGNVRGALIAHTGISHVKRVFDRSARQLRRKWGSAVEIDWHLVSPNGDLIASTNRRPLLGKLALPSAFASAAAAPGYLEEREPTRDVTMLTGYARMRAREFPTLPRWALLLHVDQRDVVGPIHATIGNLGALWALVAAPLFLMAIWATTRLRREWSESRDESARALAARRAADESEARMRAVLDHAAEGIVTVDADGKIQSFNTAAVRMFGWAPDEVRGTSLARLLPSGATGRHDRTIARCLARAVTRQRGRGFEVVGRRRNGSTFPLGLALSQVATGEQRVFIGIVRDLSEQKRAETDRGLLASIIEHTDDFVGLASMDGRVVFVNPAGRRLVGLGPTAPVGELMIEDLVHPDDRPRFHEVIVPAVLRDGRWQGELHGRDLPTGEPIPSALNLFLVHHAQSARPTGFAAVCRDLREHKRVEAENRRAQELTIAKELAEAATRAKSEFLATMSHEIRTPLNGVVGMTALLLDTRLTDEQRDYAESLRTCSASLLGVIDDILDFSKMEAGKLEIEAIDFDLRVIVEEAVELFAERALSKGVELVAAIEPATPSALRGDPNRLRQILVNLISNALKFTERGEVVVRAAAVGDAPTHAVLHLEVADTGIGIPPEQQAMIFESFSQSDVTTARRYGGSGLGLAIVKRLGELMGGQIVVDSEPGVGSTFSLVLRLEKQSNALAAAPVPALLRGRRVLVVDDSPTIRALLRSYLRALGVRCWGTEDGAHALALLRAAAARHKPYDAVLVDWDMPVMDGIELTRAIRAEPAIARVPVILLTSIGRRGAAQRASRRAGVAAFLSKPIRAGRLQTCLTSVLAPATAKRSRARAGEPAAPRRLPLAGHVLVAEDDPASQKVIARLLEKRGHRVDVAVDGRGAVEACLRRAYDLVLMDCRLPELDGFAATREIRDREPMGRRTPIVALTASTAPELGARCLAAGMDAHLGKPIRVEELEQLLQRWVARERRANEPQTTAAPASAEILDVDDLLDRVAGDLAFVRELADGLRNDRPRWLADLRAAYDSGDRGLLEQTAHAIRGSVGNLGGRAAAALAASIEKRARTASLGDGASACAELENALAHLQDALGALGDDQLAAS
jgi:PAS domain S-box-containing protein